VEGPVYYGELLVNDTRSGHAACFDAMMLCLLQLYGPAVDLPGAAHLVLASGMVRLDSASAVIEAMLEGGETHRRAGFLKAHSFG
jgi:hypothetical protein